MAEEIKKGSIVAYTYMNHNYVCGPKPTTGWFRVTRKTSKTVNLGGVWGGKVKFKGVPLAEVKEDEKAWYDNWTKSETYRCM